MPHTRSCFVAALTVQKRPVAAILIVALMPQLIGCTVHRIQRVTPAQLRPRELGAPGPKVVGITTVDGTRLTFDTLGVRQADGWLDGYVHGAPIRIDRRSVYRVWVAPPGEQSVDVPTSDLDSALAASPNATQRLVGITTMDGTSTSFDKGTNVYVLRDTLHATVAAAPFSIAMQRVRQLAVVRTDVASTVVASIVAGVGVLGLTAGVGVVIAMIGFGAGGGMRAH